MRTTLFLSGTTLCAILGLSLMCGQPATGQDRPRPIRNRLGNILNNAAPQQAEPAPIAVPRTTATPAEQAPATSQAQIADEAAIRKTSASFVKAFEAADAKAVAAHFTADAEYVDEDGTVFQGRPAIEESLTEFFAENPGCQLEMRIDALRFVSPGVAIEDGASTVMRADDSRPIETRYTTLHIRSEGQWLIASVRDQAPRNLRQHQAQLQQLDWLIGDWVDEGDDAVVGFSCEAVNGGNFLLRKFSVQIAGQEALTGEQRIGFDPLTGKLRTWVFDSEGGYGEGLWHRHGDNWVLKLTGVTADGEPASCTTIYTLINDHLMTWQSVDHEVAGAQLPDSDVITVVRKAPLPELTEAP
jgi:uncharacterized protein (TIGR02246 family)